MFDIHQYTNSELIFSTIMGIVFAFITAYYAEKKGRNVLGWFILGLLFTIFALLVIYFLPSLKDEDESENSHIMSIPPQNQPPSFQSETLIPLATDQIKQDENALWFYLDQNHKQIGPVSIFALREEWNRGLLELNSYVWTEGMEKWEKVDQLPHLKELLNKINPL